MELANLAPIYLMHVMRFLTNKSSPPSPSADKKQNPRAHVRGVQLRVLRGAHDCDLRPLRSDRAEAAQQQAVAGCEAERLPRREHQQQTQHQHEQWPGTCDPYAR